MALTGNQEGNHIMFFFCFFLGGGGGGKQRPPHVSFQGTHSQLDPAPEESMLDAFADAQPECTAVQLGPPVVPYPFWFGGFPY